MNCSYSAEGTNVPDYIPTVSCCQGQATVTKVSATMTSAHGLRRTHTQQRKRNLRRTDFLVLANDLWNFNVRGFNGSRVPLGDNG